MRVAFIARSNLEVVPGGDTTQVLATAKYLRRAGVQVDIRRSSEKLNYHDYDLLHFFNIIRPADILKHIGSGLPYLVSTIFVEYRESDRSARKGWSRFVARALSPDGVEYLKAVARSLTGKDNIASVDYLWLGHRRSVKKVLAHAACLLPNSENEYLRLKNTYAIDTKYAVIPNGIDGEVFAPMQQEKDNKMIVCAARVESIKNQLSLIRAINNTAFSLYLIGNASPGQIRYYSSCRREAGNNIFFIDHLPQSELRKYYAKARVHVLPSWFETTGLSSLEAGAMGCAVVASDRGDVREYLGDKAFYCDPSSPESIRDAIARAAGSSQGDELQKEIRKKFTWEQAAFRTIQAYSAL